MTPSAETVKVASHLAAGFWARVVVNEDSCWEWRGKIERFGYAVLGKPLKRAHRLSYEIHHGPIPDGMVVCHSCDNPPCCNPGHLFLGTPAENSRDMVNKGRSNRGERNGHARLTAPEVIEIRALRADGATLRSIAERFDMSIPGVHDVVSRRRWAHI